MTGQKENRSDGQQIRWTTDQMDDRSERQQIRKTTGQKDNRKQNRVETGQLDYKTVSQQDRLAKRHLYQ